MIRLLGPAAVLLVGAWPGAAVAEETEVAALVRSGHVDEARDQAEKQSGERARWVAPTGAGAIRAVAWSPDGRTVAVAFQGPLEEDERGVSVIAVDGWRETLRLAQDERGPVDAVALSPDGTLATAGFRRGVELWGRDGRAAGALECGRGAGESGAQGKNGAAGVAISRDGKRAIAACSDGAVRIWSIDARPARALRGVSVGAAFSTVALGRDGEAFAWGTVDGRVGLTSLTRGTSRWFGRQEDGITSVGLDAAGGTLLSSSRDGDVRLWNLASGKVRRSLRVDPGISVPAVISADGQLLVTGGPGGVRFWDGATGKLIDRGGRDLAVSSGEVLSLRPDGALLAVGGRDGLTIWDVRRGERTAEFPAVGDTGVYTLAFAPGGRQLAITSADGLRLWALDDKRPRSTVVARDTRAGRWMDIVFGAEGASARLAASPAGQRPHATSARGVAAAGEADGSVSLIDRAGKIVRSLREQPPADSGEWLGPAFTELAFSPDGAILAAGSESGRVVLWEPTTGRPISVLKQSGDGAVSSIAVSPKGEEVAIGTTQGLVEIWGVAGRSLTASFRVGPGFARALAFSPDRARLAVGMSVRGAFVFALPSHRPIARLTSVPDRAAAFWQTLPGEEIEALGADARRFLTCHAGRFILPAAACKGR